MLDSIPSNRASMYSAWSFSSCVRLIQLGPLVLVSKSVLVKSRIRVCRENKFGLLKLLHNKIAFILYSFYSHKTKHLKNKPRFSFKKLGRTRRQTKLCIACWTTSKHVSLDILGIFCCFVHEKCLTNLSKIAGLFLL